MWRTITTVVIVSLLFMGAVSGSAGAASEEREILDSLLEIMTQKGLLTKEEADLLIKEAERKVKEKAPPAAPEPERIEAKEAAPALPSTGELEFQFEAPVLAPPPTPEAGVSLGAFNLNFGGTFDSRFIVKEGKDVSGLGIHINELVMTTNIGDHISFLGEWLLETNKFVDNIQDDHGFVYAIISDIPYLPTSLRDITLKVGRFRARYGIDAELDAPANSIYTQVRKSLGFISDRGLEVEGFWKDLDYSLAVLNGPNFLENEVFDSSGNLLGKVEREITNNSKPVLVRLNYDADDWVKNLDLGFSYFEGRSWPYLSGLGRTVGTVFGAMGGGIDGTLLTQKRRLTPFAKYRVEPLKVDLAGELTWGRDGLAGDDTAIVRGYFLRADRVIAPNKLDATLQYSLWDDGRPDRRDGHEIAAGFRYFLTDAAYIRPAVIINTEYDDFYIVQLYTPF